MMTHTMMLTVAVYMCRILCMEINSIQPILMYGKITSSPHSEFNFHAEHMYVASLLQCVPSYIL